MGFMLTSAQESAARTERERRAEGVRALLAAAREAQQRWRKVPVKTRVAALRRFRQGVAGRAEELLQAVAHLGRAPAESLAAEILPLADACRFLEKRAAAILRPRRVVRRDRPFWMGRLRGEVRREALGTVLIVGPSNYPLFLPGVQMLQALAAGNGVIVKPGRGGRWAAEVLSRLLTEAGIDPALHAVLEEDVEEVRTAVEAGVEKAALTGSHETGQRVLRMLGRSCTPAVMELSGCDAVVVLRSADLRRVAKGIRFGLTLNGGRTCIAPRRVIVPREMSGELEELLVRELRDAAPAAVDATVFQRVWKLAQDAVEGGASFVTVLSQERAAFRPLVLRNVSPEAEIARSDLFAPVLAIIPVEAGADVAAIVNRCPYKLGASVFGSDAACAKVIARLDVANVVVNDVIAPTADPRFPFPARGMSGFGCTRGAEGLLEMTTPKVVVERRGRFLPHLERPGESDAAMFSHYLAAVHGTGIRSRLRAAIACMRVAMKRNARGAGETKGA